MSFLDEIRKKAKKPDPVEVNKPDPKSASHQTNMFAWGFGEYGRCGVGDKTTHDNPVQCLSYVDASFSSVALGAAHCLAISDGQVYTWGKCHVGQLGHGEEYSDEYVPRLVEKLKDVKAVRVSSGDSHSLVVTEKGELLVFGIGYYGALGTGSESHVSSPVPVEFFKTAGLKVKQAEGGEFHTIVLTESGEVYTFGRNDWGQLGVGSTVNAAGVTIYVNSRLPQKVHGLEGVKIVKVATGYNHCLVLTGTKVNASATDLTTFEIDKGEVYAWGRNTYGQLGNKTLEFNQSYPLPVKVDFDLPVTDIVSKKHWNLATTANHLYIWGKNKAGRLAGKEQPTEVSSPFVIRTFDDKKIVSMSAGYSHAIVATDDGACYSWGHNEFGKLGRSVVSVKDSMVPAQVGDMLQQVKIFQVAAGSNSCLVVGQLP